VSHTTTPASFAMQNGTRRASSASQVQRSSRTSSKHSVVSIPQGSRPLTHRSSTAIQYTDADFDSTNIDSAWFDNPDCFPTDLDGNFDDSFGSLHYDPSQTQYDGFGRDSDLTSLPNTARLSVNLLERPFSALPGTPQDLYFSNSQLPPNQSWLQQGTSNNVSPMQFKEVAPVTPIPQVEDALLQDYFGHVGNEQAYVYPEPGQPAYGSQTQPYYHNAASGYQDNDLLDQVRQPYPFDQIREPYSLDDQSNKPLRSQTQGTVAERQPRSSQRMKRAQSLSCRSESSYPDRSAHSTAEEYVRAPQPMDDNKRKSVVNQRNIYVSEQPKLDLDKPWIRINKTTRGETTRTAKVNQFDASTVYTPRPHPLGNWNSGRNDFKYTTHGEWKDSTRPATAIRDFILRYPEDINRGIKLKLMIQVTPTDSARRYLSQTWTKCRFAECPAYQNGSGTILHGHYRVAFDERTFSSSADDPYDPHLAAGAYVHLYCFERFLDMEEICRKAHVHADARVIAKEPRGKFAASLAGHPEYETVHKFIKEAMKPGGNVRKIEGWENYPHHKDYMGKPKPHEDTLVYRMHETKALARPPAQLKQFQARGIGPTHLLFNHGDLDLYMEATMLEKTTKAKKGTKRKIQEILSDDENEDEARVEFRNKVRRLATKVEQKYNLPTLTSPDKSTPCQTKTTRTKRKSPAAEVVDSEEDVPGHATLTKRKLVQALEPWNLSDSDSDDDFRAGRKPSTRGIRRSARAATLERKNYREIEEPPLRQQQIDHLNGYSQDYNQGQEQYGGYAPAIYNLPPFDISQHQYALRQHMQTPHTGARRDSLPSFADPAVEGVDLDALFAQEGLDRRSSSIAAARRASSLSAHRACVLRSAMSSSFRNDSLGTKRHASFSKQPVSHKQEFDTDAPPRDVETPPTPPRTRTQTRSMTEKDKEAEAKQKEVLGDVDSGRVGKTTRGGSRFA